MQAEENARFPTTDMPDTKALTIAIWLCLLAAFMWLGVVQLGTDGLYIDGYSGDSLFVMDILARIEAGQVPHVDFTLHLGAFPFLLIDAFNNGALAVAFVRGQLAFTAAVLSASIWIGWTRLDLLGSAVLAIAVLVLGSALSTELRPEVSLALFYNRWAWALGLLFAVLAFLDRPEGEKRIVDGAAIGALAFLLLGTKITFFVALVPLAALRFAYFRRWAELGVGMASFVVCLAGSAIWLGPAFWAGYVENLAWVATNPIRSNTGRGLNDILTDRTLFPYWAALVGFLFMAFVVDGARRAAALAVLLGVLLFIQYQNFGNIPFWILLLAIFSFAFSARSFGRTASIWMLLGLGFAWLSVGPLTPLAKSTFANAASAESTNFEPLYQADARFDGIEYLSISFVPMESVETHLEKPWHPLLAPCRIVEGFARVYQQTGALMAELGGPVLVLDTPSPEWLFGGGPPLQDAAAWNYGSIRGIEHAIAVIIPTCATKPAYQAEMLKEIDRHGFKLTEVQRTPTAIVYSVTSVSQ